MGWVDENGKSAHLEVDWRFDMNRLVSQLKAHSPVGDHSHDRTNIPYRDSKYPRTGGRLKRSWKLGKSDGVSGLKSRGKTIGVRIKNKLPYAEIIDQGGNVPAATGRMHFAAGGTDVFTKRRTGYTLAAKHITRNAVDDWAADNTAKSIKVKWA